jgi:hypothetical protein
MGREEWVSITQLRLFCFITTPYELFVGGRRSVLNEAAVCRLIRFLISGVVHGTGICLAMNVLNGACLSNFFVHFWNRIWQKHMDFRPCLKSYLISFSLAFLTHFRSFLTHDDVFNRFALKRRIHLYPKLNIRVVHF